MTSRWAADAWFDGWHGTCLISAFMAISPSDFIKKWSRVSLSERSSYQQHFLDLCELAGHPKPAEADPTGGSFCFERGAEKHGGGDGWADVWKRGFFAFDSVTYQPVPGYNLRPVFVLRDQRRPCQYLL